jgi:hypothetical protein
MRAAALLCLTLVGCAYQAVQPLGANRYMVAAGCSIWHRTPDHNPALEKANAICVAQGKTMSLVSTQTGTYFFGYPCYAQATFDCK